MEVFDSRTLERLRASTEGSTPRTPTQKQMNEAVANIAPRKLAQVEHQLKEVFKRQKNTTTNGGGPGAIEMPSPIKMERARPELLPDHYQVGDNRFRMPPVSLLERQDMLDGAVRRTRTPKPEDMSKLKATIGKYHQIVQKFKGEKEELISVIQSLQKKNEDLSEDMARIGKKFNEWRKERADEQELMTKVKLTNDELLQKNGQLQQEVTRMLDNLRDCEVIVQQYKKKEVDSKVIAQQLETITRMTQNLENLDKCRKQDEAREGGGLQHLWRFVDRSLATPTGKLIAGAALASFAIGYLFQTPTRTSATASDECDYDSELYSKIF